MTEATSSSPAPEQSSGSGEKTTVGIDAVVETTADAATGLKTDDFDLRPIKAGDVAQHAKKSCKTCFGKGTVLTVARDQNGNETRAPRVCGCAERRFFKVTPNLVHDKQTGNWYQITKKNA